MADANELEYQSTLIFRDFTDVDASKTLRIREIRGSPHLAYYGSKFITIWS